MCTAGITRQNNLDRSEAGTSHFRTTGCHAEPALSPLAAIFGAGRDILVAQRRYLSDVVPRGGIEPGPKALLSSHAAGISGPDTFEEGVFVAITLD